MLSIGRGKEKVDAWKSKTGKKECNPVFLRTGEKRGG